MSHEITDLLRAWSRGDPAAFEALLPLVEADLRRAARKFLRKDRPHHQMQTTELLDEAFVRLFKFGAERIEWRDRAHFHRIMARAMRRVLTDLARKKASRKRGGDAQFESLDAVTVIVPDGQMNLDEQLAIDEVLERLKKADERSCHVFEMRFYGGMTHNEIALVLGISDEVAKKDYQYARAWLRRALNAQAAKSNGQEVGYEH